MPRKCGSKTDKTYPGFGALMERGLCHSCGIRICEVHYLKSHGRRTANNSDEKKRPGPRFEPGSEDPQSSRMTNYPTPAICPFTFAPISN